MESVHAVAGSDSNSTSKRDRYAFMVAFGIGAAWIVFCHFTGVPKLAASGLAAMLIVAYTLLVYFDENLRVPEDMLADNAYYLGLLLTLVSLVTALFSFSGNGKVSEVLISNFGISLVTTITGLLCRVGVLQMRRDIQDNERETREALNEAVSSFIGMMKNSTTEYRLFQEALKADTAATLAQSADALKAYQKSLQDNTQARIEQSLEELETFLKTVRQRTDTVLEQTAVKAMDALNGVVQQHKGSAEAMTSATGAALQEIRSEAGKTGTALTALTQRLNDVEVDPKEIKLLLQPLADAVGVSVNGLRDTGGQFRELIRGIDVLITESNAERQQLQELRRQTDMQLKRHTKALEALDRAAATFAAFTDVIDSVAPDFTERLEQRVQAIERYSQAVVQTAVQSEQRLSELVQRQHSQLEELLGLFNSSDMRELESARREWTSTFSELASGARLQLSDLREHGAAFRSDSEASRQATHTLQKTVEDLATRVRQLVPRPTPTLPPPQTMPRPVAPGTSYPPSPPAGVVQPGPPAAPLQTTSSIVFPRSSRVSPPDDTSGTP